MEEKCTEFREYLRSSGAIDALNNAIEKLYDLPNSQRPEKPLEFLNENLFPNGKDATNNTDEMAKKLADAETTIQLLKNGRDLVENYPNSIEKAIEKLQADDSCTSLLKKHLTNKEVFYKIVDSTEDVQKQQRLFDCVKIGLIDHKQDVGLIAADGDCYTDFAPLFNPIIKEIHGKLPNDPLQLSWDYNVNEFINPDPEHKFIQRAVITCRRSLQKHPFQVKMTNEEDFSNVRLNIIQKLVDKFDDANLKNKVYKFEDNLPKDTLLGSKLIFDKNEFDDTLESIGAAKYWPVGRAAYVSDDKSYVIWVNRIDHLEFKSFDNDIEKAIERISTIGKIIDENVKPLFNDTYGWLTYSPKYIGNAMTVSIFIKLTKLSGNALDEILNKYKLIINSCQAVDEDSTIFEIQNESSLFTQFETIKNILAGIANIIKGEKDTSLRESENDTALSKGKKNTPLSKIEKNTFVRKSKRTILCSKAKMDNNN